MPQLRGVLLDFYGTLVHEDDVNIANIATQIHDASAINASQSVIEQFWFDSFARWLTRSHGQAFITQRVLALESLRETLQEFRAPLNPELLIETQLVHWSAPPIFPDASRLLSYIRSTNLRTCIVSNVDRNNIEDAIALHGLGFDHVVTREDARSYKPRPEIFEQALGSLNLNRGEVLHIGDSFSSDVRGAAKLGIQVAWVNRMGKPHGEGTVPDHKVNSLDMLIPVIEQMRRTS